MPHKSWSDFVIKSMFKYNLNMCSRCPPFCWTLQQDGARSHMARNTLCYLQRENVQFVERDMWPPNSLDLNPVVYAVWGALQQMVYHQRFASVDVDELKKQLQVFGETQPVVPGQEHRRMASSS